MFGAMLSARGVRVNTKLSRPAEHRTRQDVLSVMRKTFAKPGASLNIMYFSGHGTPGNAEARTRGALCVGRPPDLSEVPISQLRERAAQRRVELIGHRGHRKTYIDALSRDALLSLDDVLGAWEDVGGASKGSRLLLVADSCYSGKLVSRLRDRPLALQRDYAMAIQSAGNARQTVGQGHKDYVFSHAGELYDYSGCLTAYLTAKQEEGARVRWSQPAQHPQFYATWDPAAAEKPSVALDLGTGHAFRTINQPDRR